MPGNGPLVLLPLSFQPLLRLPHKLPGYNESSNLFWKCRIRRIEYYAADGYGRGVNYMLSRSFSANGTDRTNRRQPRDGRDFKETSQIMVCSVMLTYYFHQTFAAAAPGQSSVRSRTYGKNKLSPQAISSSNYLFSVSSSSLSVITSSLSSATDLVSNSLRLGRLPLPPIT